MMIGEVLRFIFIAGTPLVLGSLSGLFGKRTSWYDTIKKPSFSPPPKIFGIVWPILYVFIGIAAYLALAGSPWSLWTLYAIQLILNLSFSPIMFRLQNLLLAAIVVSLTLLFAIATTIQYAQYSKYTSVGLMIPYLCWLVFASILAWSLVSLNKQEVENKKI